MLGLAVIPSRPAADRDGQRSSVEGPPFTVSNALVTRTDGIRQELDDRLRLLEIICEVRLDQLGPYVPGARGLSTGCSAARRNSHRS